MSISVVGFKGQKGLFKTDAKEDIKELLIKSTLEYFHSKIAEHMSVVLAKYKYTGNANKALKIEAKCGSLNYMMTEFKDYPKFSDKLLPFYENLKLDLTENNFFNFYERYIMESNELNNEHESQNEIYISDNIIDVTVMEYEFENYSIYQFFYGSIKLGNMLSNELLYSGYFEDYHYYDNTDRPDDISKEEWNIRKEDWFDIIKRCGSYRTWCPKNGGESFALFDYNDIKLNMDEMKSFKLDDEETVKFLTKNILFNKIYYQELENVSKQKGFETIKDFEKQARLTEFTEIFFDASQMCKEEIKKESAVYQELYNDVKSKLI